MLADLIKYYSLMDTDDIYTWIKEFMNNVDDHVMASFKDFKDRHSKEYR